MSRSESNRYLLPISLLLLAISVIFQLRLDYVFGFHPDFILSVLIVAAFFLGFLELLGLVLMAILIVNWQPLLSPEIIVLFLAPIFAYFINLFFPGKIWFSAMGTVLLSISVLYLFLDFSFFYRHLVTIVVDVVACLVFASIIFVVFDRLKNS